MMQIIDSSDDSLTLYLGEDYDEQTLAIVTRLAIQLRRALGDSLVDLVPSYCSLTVFYDLLRCDRAGVYQALEHCAARVLADVTAAGQVGGYAAVTGAGAGQREAAGGRSLELPVYYGREAAPDLLRVAEVAGLTPEQVIELHAAEEYRVYALGFRPGFAFMGKTPAALRLPRLDTPRTRVPAGAVAIAGAQAAVYPDTCPGGWNLIGRCPATLFDRRSNPPRVLLAVGDRVRFVPVDRERFLQLGGALDD